MVACEDRVFGFRVISTSRVGGGEGGGGSKRMNE